MTQVETRAGAPAPTPELDRLAVDTLRFLAADMVEAAGSGHPGMPMGAAPMAWALWSRHLRLDPRHPERPDRDRFVLSAGHGSALLYALLHVFGYDLPEAELRRFRQLGSRTPGHPEVGHTPGVETTTGPLGQGLATAVGLALAERMRAAREPGVAEHRTFVIAGDGCLMEGISHEAASLAGHLGLGRLVVLWDDNRITIDGAVDASCDDDQAARFSAYGWQVLEVAHGTDVDAVDAAITEALLDSRPTLIAVRTVIGHGAPGVEGTPRAHGSPLGPEVLAGAKARAGWTLPPFSVPGDVREAAAERAGVGLPAEPPTVASPGVAASAELDAALASVPIDVTEATRQTSRAVLAALTPVFAGLVGGSADLAGSTGTDVGVSVTRHDAAGARIDFGIREHAMAAVLNGLALHGDFRPFGSTFLVFSDYLRPALRLAALMRQPVVHVLTHDSIAVGEDGPTHQPVEHVESLRLIPGLQVLRPADAAETVEAWRLALERTDGPTALVLTRQAVRPLGGTPGRTRRVREGSDLQLVATGSEVGLALDVADLLAQRGAEAEVLSVLDRAAYRRPIDRFVI
uniref:transketolase family protein n=1 Tax=uncultured Nocardioides sp. TaxID=198441 RepID=UPI00260BC668